MPSLSYIDLLGYFLVRLVIGVNSETYKYFEPLLGPIGCFITDNNESYMVKI